MAHITTNQYGAGYTQIGGGLATCTNSVNVGTGSNRVIIVTHMRRSDRSPAVDSVTIGGVSMTVLGTDKTISGLYVARTFVLVNPSITGTQDLVITTTTNGSNSIGDTLVSVYDGVDPNAVAANLLAISDSQTIVSPWTGAASIDISSSTGYQVVATFYAISNDVSYIVTESGTTERHNTVGGGIGKYSGDAAGATTVTASWTSDVTQDLGFALFGFSLPAAPSLVSVRQFANGAFQSGGFVEIATVDTSAAHFDASRLYKNTGTRPSSESSTFCAWVRRTGDTNNYSCICLFLTGGIYHFIGSGVSGTSLEIFQNSGSFSSGEDLTVDTWTFVAFVRNGTTTKLYRGFEGGSLAYINEGTLNSTITDMNVYIGNNDVQTQKFVGDIAFARLWSAALTLSELESEMNSSTPVKTTGLIADLSIQDHTTPGNDSSSLSEDFSTNGSFSDVTDGPNIGPPGLPVAMRIGSNLTVQVSGSFVEESGRTTHQINSSGVYKCGEIIETT